MTFTGLARENWGTMTAAIASGSSATSAVDVNGWLPVRLDMPAAWTVANVTVQVSNDNVTWQNLYTDNGAEYTLIAGSGRGIMIDPADGAKMARYVKFRSGTVGTPVNQASARQMTFVGIKNK